MDAVITWINSNDPSICDKLKLISTYDSYRIGNRDSLKYALRGLFYNCSWLDHIYLVTDNQWPEWLDEKLCEQYNPKIIRIDHKEINPNKSSMIGCPAIESCLDNIPNLSDFFLYANDDTFIIRPTDISDWIIDNKGIFRCYSGDKPKYINADSGFNYWDVRRGYKLVSELYNIEPIVNAHQVSVLSRKAYEIAKNKFPELYHQTYTMKGRPEKDKLSRTLIEHIAIAENLVTIKKNPTDCLYIDNLSQKLQNIPHHIMLLCINHIYNYNEYDTILQKIFNKRLPSELV